MQGRDGTFNDAGYAVGIADTERSRGAAFTDLNLDGLLDMVVVNRRAPIEVYQVSTAATGNWLLLDIRQTGENPQAAGAWVEIRDDRKTWHRDLTLGGGHVGGSATLMHFGLGDSTSVESRIIWPDRVATPWSTLETNRILRLTRSNSTFSASTL